jgi:hypothetical protein
MLLIAAIIFFVSSEVALTPIELEQQPQLKRVSASDYGILGATDTTLYHWNLQGNLLAVIRPEGATRIWSFVKHDGYYWVSFFRGRETLSRIYSADGELVSEDLPFQNYFNQVDGRLFTGPESNLLKRRAYSYFWLVHEQVLDGISHVTPKPTSLFFGKINEKMVAYRFDFKRVWPARHGKGFVLVNQLEPKVYLYNEQTIINEFRDGPRVPTQAPFVSIEMPDTYLEPPATPFKLDKVVTARERDELWLRWRKGVSLITWFGNYRKGYLISFLLPGKESGLVFLSQSFKTFSAGFYTRGYVVGVNRNNILVFDGESVAFFRDVK